MSLEQLTTLKPDRAWVTDADQSIVVVSRPQVVGDTLVGYVNGQYEQLPSADLKLVTVQTLAPTRTALLAVGIAAGLGGVLIAMAGNNGEVRYWGSPCPIHPVTPNDCNY